MVSLSRSPTVTQILEWKQEVGDPSEWNLWLRLPGRKRGRLVATAWSNGTWHTWDRRGIGGWNASEPDLQRAKEIAAGAAVCQGFI